MLVLLILGVVVQRVRGADTCNHVFTLGVDQPLSVEKVFTGCRVTGEGHSGS